MKRKKFFLKPRRISYGIPVLIALIFVTGIITRRNIDRFKDDWKSILPEKEKTIRLTIQKSFQEKLDSLTSFTQSVSANIEAALKDSKNSEEKLLRIAGQVTGDAAFLIIDPRNRLFYSSENAPALEEYFKNADRKKSFPYFYTSATGTFLVNGRPLNDSGKGLFLYSLTAFEKRNLFPASSSYSFSGSLEQQNDISVSLQYFPAQPVTGDGREFTVALNSSDGKAIAWATVQYPSWRGEAQNYSAIMATVQSVLIFLCALFLLLSIRPDYKRIRRPWIKPIVVAAVLVAMRYLLFYLNLPGSSFTGELSNASFFASKLGGGIVRSPIEFIITVIFLLGYSLYLLRFSRKEINNVNVFAASYLQILVQAALMFLLYWLLRGFAASIKSIVFDSTLRYFKGTEIIPDMPNLLMHSGAFLFGISFFLLSASLLIISVKIFGSRGKLQTILYIVLFHLAGNLFYQYLQPTPLFPPVAVFTASGIFIILHILILRGFAERRVVDLIIPVFASALVIMSFNVFNVELEREALKTEALELSRPDESLFRFNLTETLTDQNALELTKNILTAPGGKYNDLAFMLWNKSSLRSSLYMSAVLILDDKRKVLGKFYSADEKKGPSTDYIRLLNIPAFFITRVNEKHLTQSDAFIAINPVMNNEKICGYIVGILVYTPFVKPEFTVPSLLYTEPVSRTSILDEKQISIFVFRDSLLIGSRGTTELTRELQSTFFNGLGNKPEAWITVKTSDELLYYVCRDTQTKRIFAVGSMTKNLDWRLYNVVRILFIHLLFVVFLAIGYALTVLPGYFGKFPRRLSFRFQLLLALLITSIVPLIAVARYNRETVTRKNNIIIQNALRDKALVLERNLSKEKTIEAGIAKAVSSGMPFSLYKNDFLVYSAEEGRKNGFLNERVPPSVSLQFKETGLSDFVKEAEIGGGVFKSFYRKFKAGNETYLLCLNTLYNPVEASYSPEEIDVFIIGIYTVASLVMIFLGLVFVNRISRPLRALTTAAERISHGDYEIVLGKPRYSEIGELMTTFEKMSVELRKAQETTAGIEREKAWKDFARQVAHEIKNPLTPMKLTLQQLLISFKEKPEYFHARFEEYANMLMQQIEILNKIASEFSAFARMPSINLTKIDLSLTLREVVLLYKEDKLSILLTGTENECFINSDTGYMKRSIINLIRNAMQADATEVKITLMAAGDEVQITVEDNGNGMSEEVRANLFTKSFTTKKTGMGLGLSLTKEFIESCGGTVSLMQTEKGKTVFGINIPKYKEQVNGAGTDTMYNGVTNSN